MRGTVRIVLCEPGPVTVNSFGQRIEGDPIEHPVMAVREEFQGDYGRVDATAVGATWDRAYSIRTAAALRPQPGKWKVRDTEDALEFDIQSVVRDKPKRITLRCVARGR